MKFFQHLVLGYKNYVKGARFLIEHKLYWFALFPMILFFGVYLLGEYFADLEYSVANDVKNAQADEESINGLIWMTVKMLFFESLYIVFTKFTLYIVVILLSPLLAILSEKIEQKITGNVYPFNLVQLMKDIRRGIRIAIRNIFWEYFFFAIVLGIAAFMGGAARTFVIFAIPIAIGFYFYGFAFMDYINERRRLNIEQSIYFVSKHRGLAVAIGSIYSIFFLSYFYVYRSFPNDPSTGTQILWGTILVITFLLAATAPILAITSATLSMHDLVDLGKNEYAVSKEMMGKDKNEESENEQIETASEETPQIEEPTDSQESSEEESEETE